MKKILTILIWLLPFIALAQTTQNTKQSEDQSLNWIIELGEKGFELKKDSILLNDEFQKILNDSSYRALIYPEVYTWTRATWLIDQKELKKAFWYFINLYPKNEKNKKIVVRSVLAYEKVFKMDEVMVNTFYTYSTFDPSINKIVDGVPEIIHPDILEAKLRDVKEIVEYIYIYRKQQKGKPAK